MDENLILHDDAGNQIWFVGGSETDTLKVRLYAINERDANNKIFTVNHIEQGTSITYDGSALFYIYLL